MRIHIIACDDWVAVYKDGILVTENHSISLADGLEALGIPFTDEYNEDDPYEVDLTGWFPGRIPDESA